MSNPPPRDIKADVRCVDCLNGLFYCFGPFHQFDRYYKDGHLVGRSCMAGRGT